MSHFKRRDFLKVSSSGIFPSLFSIDRFSKPFQKWTSAPDEKKAVYFIYDGEIFNPKDYLYELEQAGVSTPIEPDFYGKGGAVEALEKKFASITGKESAIYMPSGTLANQLAISVLSGSNAKIFVQETSHVFRDEADTAQTVFNKRLIPLAKGETYFTKDDLEQVIHYLDEGEVFKSGMGAVSIENPVRRSNGKMVPLETIKEISSYCKTQNLRLHLDGARIYMAAAWSGISVKEYASYFDTVYISLYKYLGASGGAILCGDKKWIEQMPHLIKIHGGNMFQNWLNAAMALHRLEGIEERLQEAIRRSKILFARLNQLKGLEITPLQDGTNIYSFRMDPKIDSRKFSGILAKDYQIRVLPGDKNNVSRLTVNDTLLHREPDEIADNFETALKSSYH